MVEIIAAEHAATYEQSLAVFTRPVLLPEDPTYRGAQVPLRFCKIAAWLGDRRLDASGYILDQTALVQRILGAPARHARTAPPLGAYKTFQVPIADIARVADLSMPRLVDADVLQPSGVPAPARSRPTTGGST